VTFSLLSSLLRYSKERRSLSVKENVNTVKRSLLHLRNAAIDIVFVLNDGTYISFKICANVYTYMSASINEYINSISITTTGIMIQFSVHLLHWKPSLMKSTDYTVQGYRKRWTGFETAIT